MSYSEILRRAQKMAIAQGLLATSPAILNADGTVTLCAASCIAKAAVELSGDRDAMAEFNQLVIAEDKEFFVESIFMKYGLSIEHAKQIMLENDVRSESARLTWFQSLRSL